jgi:hypothetical protein
VVGGLENEDRVKVEAKLRAIGVIGVMGVMRVIGVMGGYIPCI